jgi:hypothetical protein
MAHLDSVYSPRLEPPTELRCTKKACNLRAITQTSKILAFTTVFESRRSGKSENCVIPAENISDDSVKKPPVT